MYTLFNLIVMGLAEKQPTLVIQGILDFLPILIITITALVFSIQSYRTNKKILKKLEGMENK